MRNASSGLIRLVPYTVSTPLTTRGISTCCQSNASSKVSGEHGKSSTRVTEPKQAGEDVATTKWGSPAFRVLNFELYTKPTGWNRLLGYTGTTVFLGIMGYWTFAGQ